MYEEPNIGFLDDSNSSITEHKNYLALSDVKKDFGFDFCVAGFGLSIAFLLFVLEGVFFAEK